MRVRGIVLGRLLLVLLSTGCGEPPASPTLDAGPLDAGPLDAGPLDAGPLDAGLDAGPGCHVLKIQLRVELDRLARCTRDEECGLELDPRCGCSSDRVVRRDADTSVFEALAARWRADCDEMHHSGVLERPCSCHDPIAPTYACIGGTCMHPIEAPDCTYDGAQFRVGDDFPSVDEVNYCSCDQLQPEREPMVSCTLL